jgi:hypothetical protein
MKKVLTSIGVNDNVELARDDIVLRHLQDKGFWRP